MLVATGNDVRVMSIKLADRLHNMRTLGVMRPEKQARIAKVTRDVLIPLAERLGVQALKTELEDLVFAILHPEEYAHTRELIVGNAVARRDPLAGDRRRRCARCCARPASPAEVLIRPRHFVSVHRRAPANAASCAARDFGRLLVLVGEDADCYAVLGELHTCFTPGRLGVQGLHRRPRSSTSTSRCTPPSPASDGQVAEVLIRTHQMHKVAEAGVIALGNPYAPPRTRATSASPADGERVDPTRPGWLSRLLEWQRPPPTPTPSGPTLRDDLAQDREITVFRARRRHPAACPTGATCVDAAYAQYGEDAHACIGARVNGRLATLSTVLRDGDTVQLLMGQDAASGPSRSGWSTPARPPPGSPSGAGWPPIPRPGRAPADGTAAARTGRPAAAASAATAPTPSGAAGRRPRSRRAARRPPHRRRRPARRDRTARRLLYARTARRGHRLRRARRRRHRPPRRVRRRGPDERRTGRAEVGVRWGGHRRSAGSRCVAEAFGRPASARRPHRGHRRGGRRDRLGRPSNRPREQRVRHTYTLQLPDAAGLPALMRAMRNVPGVYDVSRASAACRHAERPPVRSPAGRSGGSAAPQPTRADPFEWPRASPPSRRARW